MSWTRGNGSTDYELARTQWWIENADVELHGPDGDDGVIREWRDYKTARDQRDKDVTLMIKTVAWILGSLIAIPAALVSLSALGLIHLH